MSLYKDASLVMIPSAYKDGKLYSIRPTDGSGDFTFTRCGGAAGCDLAATRVDVNGLIEKGRENVLPQSNQFDTNWNNVNSTDTSGQAGYDGTNNAWLIQSTNTNGRIEQATSFGSGVRTFSVYAKAGTSGLIRLRMQGGANAFADFDLDNGVVDFVDNDVINAVITSVGNGWYRCSINTNDTNTKVYLYVIGASGLNLYIQDAQLEQGLVSTDYIETGASTAQAGILEDMPRLDYSGGASCPSLLLEPSRTNLTRQSEYLDGLFTPTNITQTTNYGTSPDGNVTSTRLQLGNLTDSRTTDTLTGIVTSGVTYTFSCYYKGINGETTYMHYLDSTGTTSVLKKITFTGEWQRESITFEAGSASSYTYIVDVRQGASTATDFEVWGAQCEQGSYPTSYIPTYGTSQTRSKDVGVDTLPDALEDNYTIFLELERMTPSTFNATDMLSFYGSGSSRIRFMTGTPSFLRLRLYSADGSTSSSIYDTSGEFTKGSNYKVAIVYSNGTFRCFSNGSFFGTQDVVIDASTLYLRQESILKQLLTFPTALTDSECIALTTL